MSQNDQILKHLKSGKTISMVEAIAVYRVFRLASRINDLRNQGHSIVSLQKTDPTGRRYVRYKYIPAGVR